MAVWTEFSRMTEEGGEQGLKHVLGTMWEKRMRKVIACNGDYIEK